jgi:hypothetical protein
MLVLGQVENAGVQAVPTKVAVSPVAVWDLFGKKNANQTKVFVAADVSPEVQAAVQNTLDVAVETWGSSGRLEYWVLGTDRQAALKLAEAFCKRRVASGHMTQEECLRDRDNKDHGFLTYQAIGSEALSSGKPRGSAGHNGGAQWEFHNMTSSLPLGFAGKLSVPAEDEQITILHEYWHSIQNSFIQTKNHKQRRELMGPVWFVEGSAVAMAETTAAGLWKIGKLPRSKNAGRSWPSLQQRMADKMKQVQELRKRCPTLLPDSYEGECRQLAYESGAWAVAYLMNRSGRDVLLKSFHPNVERLGWKVAFEQTFGQSVAEFEVEFKTFMDKPLEKQLSILR